MTASNKRRRLRVVVCEPYLAGSHRAWAEGLAAHSAHDVRLVTHAGGFWKWRMQGAALTLAREIDALVADWGRPDVLVAGDMVHLPALLGLARDALAGVPVVLYLHENQLTYPLPGDGGADHTYAMTNWLSLAAADRVVFNSDYHRRDLLGALPRFLRRFPDHRHDTFVDEVAARMLVLPVGIDLDRFWCPREPPSRERPPVILWNHRWEYDKDPATFFAALDTLEVAGVGFRVIVAGQSFQTVPDDFARARDRLQSRLLHFGTAPDDLYPELLQQADIVVSTARHEFFGVAIVEAMAAGVHPVLPDRLSYPELVPTPADPYLYRGSDGLVERLRWAIEYPGERRRAAEAAQQYAQRFDWHTVAPGYDALFEQVATGRVR